MRSEDTAAAVGGAELQERLRFERAIAEVSAMMVGIADDDLEEVIARALAIIGELQELDQITVHLLDPESTTTDAAAQWRAEGAVTGDWESVRDLVTRYPWSAEQLYAGRPVVVPAVGELPPEAAKERADAEERKAGAYVALPLFSDEVPLGAISFISAEPREWRDSFIARVQLFAETVAGAVRRRQLRREARALDRVERVIDEMSRRFVAATDVDAIRAAVNEALALVCRDLDYARALILRLLHDAEALELAFHQGARGSMRTGDRLPLTSVFERAGADALEDTDPFVVTRPHMPPEFAAVWEEEGYRGLLVCPLHIGGELSGVIALVARQERFSSRQMHSGRLVQQLFATVLARLTAEIERERAFDELATLKARIERERDYLREEVRGSLGAPVAESEAMQQVLERVRSVAKTGATVLLLGETGVGKEVIARYLHTLSARAEQPLVRVNCASIPSELFESEFFGHVRGAFTGAHRERRGRFELADGGTLFLDEIGEIPLALQPKLLRALQEGEVERVGDDRTRKVDVRIIAATNRDLHLEVDEGRFRADLYYRLGVFPIEVPPLRERSQDIVPLARIFLRRHAAQLGREGLVIGSREADELHRYDWPGNVRELSHAIERAVILSTQPPLELDLPVPAETPSVVPPHSSKKIRTQEELEELERQSIEAALVEAGKISGPGGAAELLGLKPSTLRDRMRVYGIPSPRRR